MRRSKSLFLSCCLFGALLCLNSCQPVQEPRQEKVELSAIQYELENQTIDFANMWYYDQLEEKTGVHVDFEEVKENNWETRLSLMFASSTFHDLILRGRLDAEEYGVAQKLLVPLEGYLEEHMPHYFSRLHLDDAAEAIPSSDGSSYYVGFLLSQNINTDGHFFINRDWLDKLGLEVPRTIEELTDVLRAFRDSDPNGNGLKDEVPYQATFNDCNTGIYNIFTAWGIPINEEFVFIDDAHQVHFAPEEPGFREGAEWLHVLCQEKLLDVESITQGTNLWGAKVNRNTCGYFSYWRLSNTALRPEIIEQFECMLPVHAQGYETCMGRLEDVVEFGAALTVQNEHIEESLRWLDAQMETESMLVAQNGPVGDTLHLREDGRYEVSYVPESDGLYSIVPVICGQFYAPSEYYKSVYVPAEHRQEKSAYCDMYEQAGVVEKNSYQLLMYVVPKTTQESARLLQLRIQLKNVVDTTLVEWMANGVTDESFQAFSENLKKAGSEEYRAIYQKAYDRYRQGREE